MIPFLCPWCESESGLDPAADDAAFECPSCLTVVLFAPDPTADLAQAA